MDRGGEKETTQHREGMGSAGNCLCLGCGFTAHHSPGVRCREVRCPKCGKAMVREGSEHHRLYLSKQAGTQHDP